MGVRSYVSYMNLPGASSVHFWCHQSLRMYFSTTNGPEEDHDKKYFHFGNLFESENHLMSVSELLVRDRKEWAMRRTKADLIAGLTEPYP